MAFRIHCARTSIFSIDSVGNVLQKNDKTITLKQHLHTSTDHRVIEDAAIPNTAGYPSIKDYLESEASDNYVLSHIDQTMIVTYLRTAGGGFA